MPPESTVSPIKPRTAASVRPSTTGEGSAQTSPEESGQGSTASGTSTPTSSRQHPPGPKADSMLQQLLADHRSVVFSEDLSSTTSSSTHPAVTAAPNGDQEGVHLNWLIELVNSQVKTEFSKQSISYN